MIDISYIIIIISKLTGSNPSLDAPCIEIEFERYTTPVSYPTIDEIEDYARVLESQHWNEFSVAITEVRLINLTYF